MAPKKDFSKMDALITMGESDVSARPLRVVGPPPPAAGAAADPQPEAPVAAPPAADVRPTPESRSARAPMEGDSLPVETEPLRKRKLTLELPEDTVLALYEHQASLRRDRAAKASETTIGWVADGLFRQALRLPVLSRAKPAAD